MIIQTIMTLIQDQRAPPVTSRRDALSHHLPVSIGLCSQNNILWGTFLYSPLWESGIHCETVLDSGFHTMDCRLLVLDYSLCQWTLDPWFQSLVAFLIPWAVFLIPKPRILDSTANIFRIPKSGGEGKMLGNHLYLLRGDFTEKEDWEIGTQQMGAFHLS